jgi:hypothetical protein
MICIRWMNIRINRFIWSPQGYREVLEGNCTHTHTHTHTQASFNAMRYKGRDFASGIDRKLSNWAIHEAMCVLTDITINRFIWSPQGYRVLLCGNCIFRLWALTLMDNYLTGSVKCLQCGPGKFAIGQGDDWAFLLRTLTPVRANPYPVFIGVVDVFRLSLSRWCRL